jgi:hypothetical protein
MDSCIATGGRYIRGVVGDRPLFFISHAGCDRAWAEWVAWQLSDSGYSVELDVWDWAPGQNLMLRINDALARCDRIVALLSQAYFERHRYTTDEWTAGLVHQPGAGTGRLVPVRVDDVPVSMLPPVLQPLVFCDLFGLDADEARRVLLAAVEGSQRPDEEPIFPGRGRQGGLRQIGGSGPRLPGSLPRVWNLPPRNPGFTGRDELLVQVREQLTSGSRAVVQAFQGMGGVGKTQLATEYAYRFSGAYDMAWWVDSEQPGLIGDQFARLGAALGCVDVAAGGEVVRAAVLAELRERGRWLLLFDNAKTPADVRPWLPGGGGHVLITSREHGWRDIALPVEVYVLARRESVTILHEQVEGLSEADADHVADQLGDLPLAVEQAAAFMAATGMPADQYLRLLQTQATRLLDQAVPGSYPQSLAAVTRLTVDQLAADDPAAAELAGLCAFLGPEPIPVDLFTDTPGALPGNLTARAADPLAWRQTLRHLARGSMARLDQRGLVIHRLTQAILRDRFTRAQATDAREHIEAVLIASYPGDPANAVNWPRWAQLMPHLLAESLADTNDPALRWVVCDACSYLLDRGDIRAGHDLAYELHQRWRERLGEDHENTLAAAHHLAWALQGMGSYPKARELDEDTLVRRRRVLGDDHPQTLISANSLAIDLRNLEQQLETARLLDQDTLDRRRRVLGDDHPHTLISATSLAGDLRLLGQADAARVLDQETLARRRRVLGDDHSHTMASAHNLAADLRLLGQAEAARELDEDTLARRRRILGDDHPHTLLSASSLAADLRVLGQAEAARVLDQDTLDRRRRVLGDDHPDTRTSRENLAIDLRALGTADDDERRPRPGNSDAR